MYQVNLNTIRFHNNIKLEEYDRFECGLFGHSAYNCRKAFARIVFYYCGRPDTISTECPSRVCVERRATASRVNELKLNLADSKNESVNLI